MFSIIFLLSFVFILLGIAFFTLLERKILSLTQIRVGPNKVSFFGILQPVFDGIKLLIKEFVLLKNRSKMSLHFIPSLTFILIILIWTLISRKVYLDRIKWRLIILIIVFGLGVYAVLITGCISASKFGILGGMRAAAQRVRYEISLSFLLFPPLLLSTSFCLNNINTTCSLLLFPLFICWWISCIAECNRAPFDFAEGERELIRGFNLEYGRRSFVFIFLGEYGIILVLSFLSCILFFNSFLLFFLILFSNLIILRSSYPRFRYDMLIKLCWIQILPISIFFLILPTLIK